MNGRIVLVRHGKSAHASLPGWVNAADISRWRDGYNAAGLIADETPPSKLVEEVASADLLVASELPRAIESARLLAPNREVFISRLFSETTLEIPAWVPLRWPAIGWAIVIHLQWGLRILLGTDASSAELKRASNAAEFLENLTKESHTIYVVTHGVFRRLLANRLVAIGWKLENRRRSYSHWSTWAFTRTCDSNTSS